MKLNKSNELNQPNSLVLGTAQLGMAYGIANTTGQPVYNTAMSIVQEAWESGICEFDTAQDYGQSEQVLGQVFKNLGIADEVRVITKFAPDVNHSDRSALDKALKISMNNLGVESLYGLMLHREDMLDLWEKGLGEDLMDIVDSNRVEHIGVSVYSPEKAIQALNTEGISIVQLPTNIIDRRFEKAGVFDLAKDAGKTIYIRSIFLQGLLLLKEEELSENMLTVLPALKALKNLCSEFSLSKREIALAYVKMAMPTAKVIFGAETSDQVKENINSFAKSYDAGIRDRVREVFTNVDERILNPVLWKEDCDIVR